MSADDRRLAETPGTTTSTTTLEAPTVADVAARLRLTLMRLARRLRQESEGGLTPSMMSVLSSIHGSQPVTLGSLAALERVQPPTITSAVSRLEDAGLVSRQVDSADRRIARVSLTEQGDQLIRRNRTRKDVYLSKRLRRLPPEDLATLNRAASIIERLIEERP